MPDHEQRPRITVEDLLRLKRAERPAQDFWASFEKELRQKQLTALLEKKPWWQGMPRFALRHAYLPVSAAAAIALAFVATNRFTTAPAGDVEPVQAAVRAAEATQPVAQPLAPADYLIAASQVAPEETATAGAAVDTVVVAATVPSDVAALIPWSAPRSDETPSPGSIARTIAQVEQIEPEMLESALGGRPVLAVRAQPVSNRAVLELASVTVTQTQPRQSNRLLVGYEERAFIPEATAPDRVRERIARRLADAELLDDSNRLDFKADRLSLKL